MLIKVLQYILLYFFKRLQVLRTLSCLKQETRNLELWNPELGTRNPEPGTWNLELI